MLLVSLKLMLCLSLLCDDQILLDNLNKCPIVITIYLKIMIDHLGAATDF